MLTDTRRRVSLRTIAYTWRMQPVPDFDDAERWVLESTLRERYGHRVATQQADTELRLRPADPGLTACPTLYWEQRGAAFVVVKVGDGRFRAMFFYHDDPGEEQFGAGRAEYDDLLECASSVLRAQADHEKEREGVYSGRTGGDLRGAVGLDLEPDRDPEDDPDAR